MISTFVFAALMAIKGGWLGRIPGWKKLDQGVAGFFLDGTRLSSLFVLMYTGYLVDPLTGLCFALAWFVGNLGSMGEEAGAIGRAGRIWGPFVEKLGEGREYGIKQGLQRGICLGALLTLATFVGGNPSPWFTLAGASFPLAYFAGSTLHWKMHHKDSWAYAEPLYGAVIGVAAWQWLGG